MTLWVCTSFQLTESFPRVPLLLFIVPHLFAINIQILVYQVLPEKDFSTVIVRDHHVGAKINAVGNLGSGQRNARFCAQCFSFNTRNTFHLYSPTSVWHMFLSFLFSFIYSLYFFFCFLFVFSLLFFCYLLIFLNQISFTKMCVSYLSPVVIYICIPFRLPECKEKQANTNQNSPQE